MFKEILKRKILGEKSVLAGKASTKKTSFSKIAHNLSQFKDKPEMEEKCEKESARKMNLLSPQQKNHPDEDPELEPVPWKRAILDDDDED
ncbi:MAG: hypothetical protein NTY68_04805 [Candidatus Micrarchaeota archaeon]|nr:hypothetical protein [Candidatus Micrarchaeota archaeon]